jgi:hypothetical protein
MASIFYCIKCAWFQGNGKCAAFPNGIPESIKKGIESHDEVVKGQEGEFVFTLPKDVKLDNKKPGN